jgi:tRNA U34 5-carboxymethylaminomethyl modifying GTPase MnmE/TrmE
LRSISSRDAHRTHYNDRRATVRLIARLEASLDFLTKGFTSSSPRHAAAEIDEVIAALDDLLGGAAAGRMIREGASVVIADGLM